MRRALGLLVVLALALGVLAANRPSAHAATACAKHTKRVVKHVKRHGKRTKVVRHKSYWTCEEVPAAAPPNPAAAPGSPAPTPSSAPVGTPPVQVPPAETPVVIPPPEGEPEPEANALGVAANDRGGVKSYTLSRLTVRPGNLTVQLQNKGEDPHDMDIQRIGPSGEPLGEVVKVPVTEPGANADATVPVEAGRYRMWCDLYNHAKEGMEATVIVE